MIGAILAVLYFFLVWIFGEPDTFATAFKSATNFLFWWYLIVFIIKGIFPLLATLGIVVVGAVAGADEGSLRGALLGALGFGTVFTGPIWFYFLGRYACLLVGVRLLSSSVIVVSGGAPEWDGAKLIIGGILVIIARKLRKLIK